MPSTAFLVVKVYQHIGSHRIHVSSISNETCKPEPMNVSNHAFAPTNYTFLCKQSSLSFAVEEDKLHEPLHTLTRQNAARHENQINKLVCT
jgi:hypothetical protein